MPKNHDSRRPVVVVKGFLPSVTPKKILTLVARTVHGALGTARDRTAGERTLQQLASKSLAQLRTFIEEGVAEMNSAAEAADKAPPGGGETGAQAAAGTASGPSKPSSLKVRFLPVSQYLLELVSGAWALECGVLTSREA